MEETGPSGTRDLDDLALQHGTDKSSLWHDYAHVYHHYFWPLKLLSCPIRIIEIGVAQGASLKMWRDFFEHCQVIGIDNNPKVPTFEPPIEVIVCCQTDRGRLEAIGDRVRPHIVVDDGSHFAAHQEASFETLWPFVVPGGYYAIEDLHTAYREGYGSILPKIYNAIDRLNRFGQVEFASKNAKHPGKVDLDSIHFHQSLVLVRKSLE